MTTKTDPTATLNIGFLLIDPYQSDPLAGVYIDIRGAAMVALHADEERALLAYLTAREAARTTTTEEN